MNCFFAGLMLEHRLRSSPTINATSGECWFGWAVSGRLPNYIYTCVGLLAGQQRQDVESMLD